MSTVEFDRTHCSPNMNFFSVNSIAFELLNNKVSYLELAGTIFSLWGVWLMTRNRILSWPVGLVSVVLSLMLFWQIQLYADVFEQLYYIPTGLWGWWLWKRSGAPDEGPIRRSSLRDNLVLFGITSVLALLGGWINSNIHFWMPRLFAQAASFAYLDAATTIFSFTAQILMARRCLECWPIWIAVDVIGIWLYWQKGVIFYSALYAIFLVLAVGGLLSWHRRWSQAQQLN